jgi:tRNA (adenine37-N6)-methyltransferase
MPDICLSPIAWVHNSKNIIDYDCWGGVISELRLYPSMPDESLEGIEAFSHAEIIFIFHLVEEEKIVHGARHPRENNAWPKVGILAQRGRLRPNRIGLSIVRILQREGRSLFVTDLDAVNGSPVLDIKPVMDEFLPRGQVKQPNWSHELMADYWNPATENADDNKSPTKP